MKILLLTHSFNSLTQRLYVEIERLGYDLSVEFDINDSVTIEAVDLFKPDLIIAPFLKRAIPQSVWSKLPCLIVHPGPKGDRGPSSLDWAILRDEKEWGVTLLQAVAEMDAGPIWATRNFPMRTAPKSSLYRNEVTEMAVECVLEALDKFNDPDFTPEPLEGNGTWNDLMKQSDRAIDWQVDDSQTILNKVNSADGNPGLLDGEYYLHNARLEPGLSGTPGEILATRNGAICKATTDGAIWVGHLRKKGKGNFKLPATRLLDLEDGAGERDIYLEINGQIGHLHFPFHNGAMNTDQCHRLLTAYKKACTEDIDTIVLRGGDDFFSNGIHLNTIEDAERPAEESWANINAMDDLCEAIITTTDKVTVAALSGNAGAGGMFFALCCDRVYARCGVILNPHYKNMGNLFGSEYWTYLLPKRVGAGNEDRVMQHRLPIGATEAVELGLLDGCFGKTIADFHEGLKETIATLDNQQIITDKSIQRETDEAEKPLQAYRDEELDHMKLNFFGFDPSYHVARFKFVLREAKSHTPLYLAKHRQRVKNSSYGTKSTAT
ncbi:hydrogenase maturation protein [Terasakiella sp. A23]|uniref:hydrogenase maturation protein n=1 Tax=Terasakiella sp. FCG-A23 TaxID=3080561 RepID=UPI0029536BE7|nr:hydrogenase maturation protein [Terasakiella sp. A23]MDV7338299.1 hydrogenase maturation protein [Terasakiella sp. A23]